MNYLEYLKEIKRLESQISKCDNNLSNERFISNAPEKVIVNERNKKHDFTIELNFVKNSLANELQIVNEFLIEKFEDKIIWHIEYLREKTEIEKYTKEWFDFIYDPDIKTEELFELYQLLQPKKLEKENK